MYTVWRRRMYSTVLYRSNSGIGLPRLRVQPWMTVEDDETNRLMRWGTDQRPVVLKTLKMITTG
ncbi:hypothetical protein BX666DRAFT_1948201 [Dichotomocladium elegans]|nr:hypothetical protein BX666DRAFT_1948201 [Dichotomocladium elegans]